MTILDDMHGQKKRRKRTADGLIELEGTRLKWELVSEPQITTEDGYKGLCISVRMEDGHHRELILEYPFIKKSGESPKIPQRPKFSDKTVEAGIRQAIAGGWTPDSRGKTIVHRVSESPN